MKRNKSLKCWVTTLFAGIRFEKFTKRRAPEEFLEVFLKADTQQFGILIRKIKYNIFWFEIYVILYEFDNLHVFPRSNLEVNLKF